MPAPVESTVFEEQVKPGILKYCGTCHSADKRFGGICLTAYQDAVSLQTDQTGWRKVVTRLRDRTMPPPTSPKPSEREREQLVTSISQILDAADNGLLLKDPGRVLIHRLNRTEYNNTIRDLLGIDTKPADNFPLDGGGGGGFDNNAETLFIPPILMERYLQSAGEVLDSAKSDRFISVRPDKSLSARDAARKSIEYFVPRAFRRPAEKSEIDRFVNLFVAAAHLGKTYDDSLKYAVKAVLVSPSFLFRVERSQPTTRPYRISDYELASRLSYFLWSSMPDAELFLLARMGRLHDPRVLEEQVRRMIRDPNSSALADGFAGQWLKLKELFTVVRPDPRRFPNYSDSLRSSMYNEAVELFQDTLQGNQNLLNLLDADYTFVDEDLAKLYGIEGVKGREMRKVKLADHRRGGLITMAGVLTLTSFPQRTSPVLRGKWVLDELLGARVPPPPPNVGSIKEGDAPKDGITFRQRMEQHRSKPECAGCHSRMDPIGFGLENFDAIGRWREDIGGVKVDCSGHLATGEEFNGPVELKKLILDRKEEFLRNLTEKMLSYSLGRGVETYDAPTVQKIAASVAKDGYRGETLIQEIVKSYPFLYRKNL